jgi:hypothetical protein
VAQSRMVRLPWTTLISSSSGTPVFWPLGDFMPTGGITSGRGWLEVRALSGLITVAPAYQMANDVRSPDTAVALNSYQSADGILDPTSANTTITTDGKKYIRAGIMVQLSSGSSVAYCCATGVVDFISA